MYMCNLNKNTCTCLLYMTIEYMYMFYYTIIVRQRKTLTEGSEEMEMTTAELNQYLENIAKLIEATAENAEAAAKIVRDSKVKA